MQASTSFFLHSVKLIECVFPEVIVVSSTLYVGPSQRIKISFSLLLTCAEQPIFTPKIIIFLPNLLSTKTVPLLSNKIPHPEYLYLSIPTFLTSLTVPNK